MISYSVLGILWVGCAWFWLRRLRRQHPAPGVLRPLAATSAIVTGALALTALWCGWLIPDKLTDGARQRLDYARGYVAGRELTTMAKGESAILFCAADETDSPRVRALRQGLLAGGVQDVTVEGIDCGQALRRAMEETDASVTSRLTARDFDRTLQSASRDGAWVFAVELPRDFGRMKLWKKGHTKPLYWLETNDAGALQMALEKGVVTGFCSLRDDAQLDDVRISTDPETAFASRYQWIAAK